MGGGIESESAAISMSDNLPAIHEQINAAIEAEAPLTSDFEKLVHSEPPGYVPNPPLNDVDDMIRFEKEMSFLEVSTESDRNMATLIELLLQHYMTNVKSIISSVVLSGNPDKDNKVLMFMPMRFYTEPPDNIVNFVNMNTTDAEGHVQNNVEFRLPMYDVFFKLMPFVGSNYIDAVFPEVFNMYNADEPILPILRTVLDMEDSEITNYITSFESDSEGILAQLDKDTATYVKTALGDLILPARPTPSIVPKVEEPAVRSPGIAVYGGGGARRTLTQRQKCPDCGHAARRPKTLKHRRTSKRAGGPRAKVEIVAL